MTVQGLSRLQRKLRLLPIVATEEIAKAMEQGAQEIVDLARALVPIDEMVLYESIAWTWGDAPKGSITLARSRRAGRGNLRITVYAGNDQAYYARWVEFGTKAHSVSLGGGTVAGKKLLSEGFGLGHPGARAQPFFFPAYRASRRRVRSRISRATTSAARKVAAGGA